MKTHQSNDVHYRILSDITYQFIFVSHISFKSGAFQSKNVLFPIYTNVHIHIRARKEFH